MYARWKLVPRIALCISCIFCLAFDRKVMESYGDFVKKTKAAFEAKRWEMQRSPFLVANGKVFFLQPDLTITVLDLKSGKVLSRDVSVRRYMRTWQNYDRVLVRKWVVTGNFAVADLSHGIIIVDTRTGRIAKSIPHHDGESHDAKPVASDGFVYFFSPDRELMKIDTETLEIRRLEKYFLGDIAVAGGLFFTLSSWMSDNQKLSCYDIKSGKFLWSRRAPHTFHWLKMTFEEEVVRVALMAQKGFEELGEDSTNRDKKKYAYFSFTGTELSENDGRVADFQSTEQRDHLEKMRRIRDPFALSATIATVVLDDGSVAGIGSYSGSRKDGYAVFWDGKENNSWKGRLAGMDDLGDEYGQAIFTRSLFSLEVTDEFVLVGTPNGKVECLDRGTGRSQWIYKYPGFNYMRWGEGAGATRYAMLHWEKWWSGFYVNEYLNYQKSLSLEEQGVVIDGDTMPSSTVVHVDPSPLLFPPALLTPFLVWGCIAVCVMMCLFCLFCQRARRFKAAAARATVVFVLGLSLFVLFGSYSAEARKVMIAIIILSVILRILVHNKLKAKRGRVTTRKVCR